MIKAGVDIGFPIIADLSMQVAKAYGMIQPGASDTIRLRLKVIKDTPTNAANVLGPGPQVSSR